MKLSRPVPPAEPEINENADAALGRLESLVMPKCELCNWPSEYGHEEDCQKARKPKSHGKCSEADCNHPDCDCWEQKDHRPLLARHKQLGAFYGTDDYAAMVDSMARQIEKLQERHPTLDDGKPPMLSA